MVVYVLTCENTNFREILDNTVEKCNPIDTLYVSDDDCRVRTDDDSSLTTLYVVSTDDDELVEKLELEDYLVGFGWCIASSPGTDVKKIALYRTWGHRDKDEYDDMLKKADMIFVIMDDVHLLCACTDDPCGAFGYLVYIESTSTQLNALSTDFFEELFSCSVE